MKVKYFFLLFFFSIALPIRSQDSLKLVAPSIDIQKERAIELVKSFNYYLSKLSSNAVDNNMKDIYMKEILEMFVAKGESLTDVAGNVYSKPIIEITSESNPTKVKKITVRPFVELVKRGIYKSLTVRVCEILLLKDFHATDNGLYEANITVCPFNGNLKSKSICNSEQKNVRIFMSREQLESYTPLMYDILLTIK